jgi:acyl-CoA synthetase (AMP-forming)/AMP-acid ligase II
MASIWARLASAGPPARLCAPNTAVAVADLRRQTALDRPLADFADRSVLVATWSQLAAALALIELDGIARRMIIAPPDFLAEHLPVVFNVGEVDAVVTDDESRSIVLGQSPHGLLQAGASADGRLAECAMRTAGALETEWVLMTSGTTGIPKLAVHTLSTLTAAIPKQPQPEVVWATFYDLRRYGGLQIFLRALYGGGSFVMSDAAESVAVYLDRLAQFGATHVSGTPSHWRRVLMAPASDTVDPRYVRMSGEVADQSVLNALCARFPRAGVSHAFASTEAGVGFAVDDGLAGFPSAFVGRVGNVDVQVAGGCLRLRSAGVALRYLGTDGRLAGPDGFVDTGDIVELRGDRYFFLGRRSGVINIGGLKVYPEEVEAAINRHPAVRMSLVRPKRSPITGALVAADVVLRTPATDDSDALTALRQDILTLCRRNLAVHKVPAMIHFVPELKVATAGKLARTDG